MAFIHITHNHNHCHQNNGQAHDKSFLDWVNLKQVYNEIFNNCANPAKYLNIPSFAINMQCTLRKYSSQPPVYQLLLKMEFCAIIWPALSLAIFRYLAGLAQLIRLSIKKGKKNVYFISNRQTKNVLHIRHRGN